jgi:hypothetical protein
MHVNMNITGDVGKALRRMTARSCCCLGELTRSENVRTSQFEIQNRNLSVRSSRTAGLEALDILQQSAMRRNLPNLMFRNATKQRLNLTTPLLHFSNPHIFRFSFLVINLHFTVLLNGEVDPEVLYTNERCLCLHPLLDGRKKRTVLTLIPNGTR